MIVKVIKRKASSRKNLSYEEYIIDDVTCLEDLCIQIMRKEWNRVLEVKPLDSCEIEEKGQVGKVSFGLYNENKETFDHAVRVMKQDFEDGLFRVFFNGQEYQQLDQQLTVFEENELVIIKLVMMAGRLW